jgi:hypothetical protein
MGEGMRTGLTCMGHLIFFLQLLTTFATRADTIRVPKDYPTIQDGVNAASPGDSVVVSPGIYYEHDILVTPAIYLIGENGSSSTLIDALHMGNGIIGADSATISGFTITNPQFGASGIRCYETSLVIAHNVVRNDAGFAIVLFKSSAQGDLGLGLHG